MASKSSCALYLHYHVKSGQEDHLLGLIEAILARCAEEEDFITGVLHRTEDRPGEFTLYELWRGTKEHFLATQGTRDYRRAYIEASKPLVDSVDVTWDIPMRVWGGLVALDLVADPD